MAPKQNDGKKNAEEQFLDHVETPSDDEEDLVELMLGLSLEDFLGDVPASSTDTLQSVLPKLLEMQEQIVEKTRATKKELTLRDRENKKVTAKERLAKKKIDDKKARETDKASIIQIVVVLNGVEVKLDVPKSMTVGDLRRAIIIAYNEKVSNPLAKKMATKMTLDMNGTVLSETPRATLFKKYVQNGCRLSASIALNNPPQDDDEGDDTDDEDQ